MITLLFEIPSATGRESIKAVSEGFSSDEDDVVVEQSEDPRLVLVLLQDIAVVLIPPLWEAGRT